jgi:transcriptional regulator with XRE-family HTH domain
VIRKARRVVGLTQPELVDRADLSSVSRYENYELGYAELSEEEIDRVLRVLEEARGERPVEMVPLSSLSCVVPDSLDARRGYRVDAELSQQELAARMGVSQSFVYRFEKGKANLSPKQARRWYDAIKAAKENLMIETLEKALSPIPVDPEVATLREQVKNLTEVVENLKQQLKNAEAIEVTQGEENALQHFVIEELKERFGKEADKFVANLE